MTQHWADGKVDVGIYNVYEMLPQFISPDPPILANADFRRALLRASDRQLLVDSFMFGKSSVADSTVVVPTQKEYRYVEAQIVRYPYDPRSAASTLASLGYSPGAGGRLVDSADEPPTLEIRFSTSDEIPNKITLALRDQWQAVGIGVDAVPIPAARSRDSEYRDTRPAFEVLTQRPLLQHYLSKEVPTAATNFIGDNPTRYSNPELDALINRYTMTMPWDARMDAFGKIVHHLSSELVDIGIFYSAQPVLIGNRLLSASAAKSVPPANQVWNAHEWDVR